MVYKSTKFLGLKIIVEPEEVETDKLGRGVSKKAGKYIKFNKGIFRTEDKDVIEFMQNYMKINRDIEEIDEEEAKIRADALMKAEEEIRERREEKKAKRKKK